MISYLSTSPARRVYISCLKSSEMNRLRTALTYTCIIAPLLSEHDQGLGRIRCSVLIFVLASIYYMRALVILHMTLVPLAFPAS